MKILRSVLSVIVSIILATYIVSIIAILLLRNTIFKEEYILKLADESDVYSIIMLDLKDKITSSGVLGALSADFLNDALDKEMIKEEARGILKSVFTGEEYVINTTEFEQKLTTGAKNALTKYNIPQLDSIDKLLSTIIKPIVQKYESVLVELKDSQASEYISKAKDIANKSLLTSIAIAIICIVFLFVSNKGNVKYFIIYLSSGIAISVITLLTLLFFKDPNALVSSIPMMTISSTYFTVYTVNSLIRLFLISAVSLLIFIIVLNIGLYIYLEFIGKKQKE